MKREHEQLKIVMPVVHYPPVIGGFEVFLENIVRRVGRYAQVHVITGKVRGAPRREEHHGLVVERTASLYKLADRSYSSYWYIMTTLPILLWQTVVALYRERADVLHANGFFNGIVCALVRMVTGVPYVMTIQSADFTIYHDKVRFNVIAKLQSFVERLIYKNAQVTHAVSSDLCRHYQSQGIDECVMIPNGVETDIFQPTEDSEQKKVRRQYGIPEGARVVLTTSRLEHKNGVHDLIDAVSELPDNVHLVIAGDGTERDRLEKQAKERGIKERTHFLGHVDHEKLGLLVASADVYARTPLSEGFGIVFLEAMAAGVPVVATPVGGIPDFITDGKTGVFVEVGNSSSIAEGIKRILESEKLSKQLVENGHSLVSKKYNWNTIADEFYEKVYKKAVEK